MANAAPVGGRATGVATTQRTDRWWVEPMLTGVGFGLFVIYTTWAALQGEHYFYRGYLSPFYSPVVFTNAAAPGNAPVDWAWLGDWPGWWPGLLPASPAIFILAFPLSFRMTCYYYRKFYYRSYFLTPPGCAVTAFPRKDYRGETGLFLFQNLHRYALYFAIAFVFILSHDAYLAFWRDGKLGFGLGTLVLVINPILLGLYTFSCHSFRHLIGGHVNCFSCTARNQNRHAAWSRVSALNAHHMRWAWLSLCWVAFADIYIRLVSMGVIKDISTWG